jgi:ABC-2 type transport system ATP-binding protein
MTDDSIVFAAPASLPDEARAEILLGVNSITKCYGGEAALADVSFDIQAGQIIGIIGPNGAGKTTLLEAVAGILPIDKGDVRWRGMPLRPLQRRDFMFYLPDGVRPYPDQPVARILTFFADVYRRSPGEVGHAIELLGLAPVLHKRVHSLSKGYARRLMLALGLLTPHPLLLMDEPFDGFDLRQVREVFGILRKEADKGRTLVLAIHQLLDAERVCNRIVLLANGRVRGTGTLNDLRTRTGLSNGNLEDIFLALTSETAARQGAVGDTQRPGAVDDAAADVPVDWVQLLPGHFVVWRCQCRWFAVAGTCEHSVAI